MSRKKQSRGVCFYCDAEFAKGGMIRHLSSCPKRQETITLANHKAGKVETLYHLRVQDAWDGDFWLNLEMRDTATLEQLDRYLRAIWLECCGHLSRFSYGGWGSDDISKKRKAGVIFKPGVELVHQYDFGTTSETLIKVMDSRQGKPTTKHPITLMARNSIPEWKCVECDQPATFLCFECLVEDDVFGTLCDQHAETHHHVNYDEPMPLVNSPRLGMCGYEGPADPPY